MKRWIIYIVAFAGVALFGASPFHGTDIAKLAPVEAVWLAEKDGRIYLETDTGDRGWGEDVQAALADMKAAAPGSIFLETADYLIVETGSEDLLSQVYDVLRPGCMVCGAAKMPDMGEVAEFLAAHEPGLTLRRYRVSQGEIPMLTEQTGRFSWNGE